MNNHLDNLKRTYQRTSWSIRVTEVTGVTEAMVNRSQGKIR